MPTFASSSARHPTMAAGVPGVLGAHVPGAAEAGCSLPNACATTHHHGTMGATARGKGLFIGPATSLRVHHPVSVAASACVQSDFSLFFSIFKKLFFFSQGKSYRQEQCELRNGPQTDPKGVKTFVEWVPKYAGVLPKDVCKLTCRAKGTGYYVVFSQRVCFNKKNKKTAAVHLMRHK